ncbi:MAG: Uma2 family endonuclease [Blastocatellia bacterium]
MAWVNMSPLVKQYTLDEFWQLPDSPDGSKLELIAGVLYMSPPPESTHDNVISRIIRLLTSYLDTTNRKGRLYVPRAAIWTGQNTYLEPDLFYVSAELESKLDPDHRTTADLVIEVLSPGSAIYDRNTKADTYGALGVFELWLVDQTNKTVEVRNQTGNGFGSGVVYKTGEQVASAIFPDLILPVGNIFLD